jgi:hypothetical protein
MVLIQGTLTEGTVQNPIALARIEEDRWFNYQPGYFVFLFILFNIIYIICRYKLCQTLNNSRFVILDSKDHLFLLCMITSKMKRLLFVLTILLCKTEFDIHSQSLISKMNVLPTEFPELIPFRDSDLWGYSNSSGEIIIQPKYKHVDFFYGELAIAIVEATPQKTNSDFLHYRYLCDVIDRKGNVIKQVDDVIPYNLTRTSVLIEDSITYILDIKGNIKELGPGQALVTHTESHLITRNTLDPLTTECSLWTINGEFVKMIPCAEAYEQYTLKKYTQLSEDYYPLYEFTDEFRDNQGIFQTSPFINGLAIVSKNQLIGVLDTLGNHVVPFQIFTLFQSFTEGMALVQQNGLYYYLNTSGQKLELPGKLATDQSGLLQEPSQFSNGSVVIFYEDSKGKWILFMSKTGKAKKIDATEIDEIGMFKEGLCPVKTNAGLWGVLNSEGKFTAQPTLELEDIGYFSEGLCLIKKDGKYGFIDASGSQIIPPAFDYASHFYHGFSHVEDPIGNDIQKVISKTGEIQPFSMRFEDSWNGNHIPVYDNTTGLCGLVRSDGELVIPCEYKRIRVYKCGLAYVSQSEIDENIWQPYDGLKVYEQGGFINLINGQRYFRE